MHRKRWKVAEVQEPHSTATEAAPPILTESDRLVLLTERIRFIDIRIVSLYKSHPARKALGKEKMQLQAEISFLKKSIGYQIRLEKHFMSVAKRVLDAETYSSIMQEAKTQEKPTS